MSHDIINPASAINLADAPATILLPIADLDALFQEVRSLRSEFDALDADLKRFKVFGKTGQVDDLFEGLANVESRLDRLEVRPLKPGEVHEARLKKLDYLLTSRNNEPMTFSEIGKILELGSRSNGHNTRRQAMTKFSKNLDPKNYEVFSSSTQSGKMVKLTNEYANHLKMGMNQV